MMTYEPEKRINSEEALNDVWFSMFTETSKFQHDEILESMKNLSSFNFLSTMQKAILTYMAEHVINKTEEEHYRKIFELFDTNHDGQLSKEELLEGYKMLFVNDVDLAYKEVEKTMKRVDINKNGAIDYNGLLIIN